LEPLTPNPWAGRPPNQTLKKGGKLFPRRSTNGRVFYGQGRPRNTLFGKTLLGQFGPQFGPGNLQPKNRFNGGAFSPKFARGDLSQMVKGAADNFQRATPVKGAKKTLGKPGIFLKTPFSIKKRFGGPQTRAPRGVSAGFSRTGVLAMIKHPLLYRPNIRGPGELSFARFILLHGGSSTRF